MDSNERIAALQDLRKHLAELQEQLPGIDEERPQQINEAAKRGEMTERARLQLQLNEAFGNNLTRIGQNAYEHMDMTLGMAQALLSLERRVAQLEQRLDGDTSTAD